MDWLLVPGAYLLGSIQPGLLLIRMTRGMDVRDVGSGKTGVTNVLRTGGKGAALVVLVMDCGKGSAAALVARALSESAWVEAGAAAAVMVGHVFPVFAGFRGGRGVATGVGAAGGLLPWTALVGVGIFAPVVLLTRYVSLGSVLAVIGVVAAYGAAAATLGLPLPHLWFALGCGPLVVWMHRDNIQRLLRGTERRLGDPPLLDSAPQTGEEEGSPSQEDKEEG